MFKRVGRGILGVLVLWGMVLGIGRKASAIVNTADIANNAVTSAKVANGAVTNVKIRGVSASKISGQIGTSQIADGAITADKLAPGVTTCTCIGSSTVIGYWAVVQTSFDSYNRGVSSTFEIKFYPSGIFMLPNNNGGINGDSYNTYTVTGNSISFSYYDGIKHLIVTSTGTIADDWKTMSGTLTDAYNSGTWNAVKYPIQ